MNYTLLQNQNYYAVVHLPTVPIEKYRILRSAIKRDGFPSSHEEGSKGWWTLFPCISYL